eukprot:scaffold7638_cov131-Isochrysis_galbana.AAC.10
MVTSDSDVILLRPSPSIPQKSQLNSLDSYFAAFLSDKTILRLVTSACAPIPAAPTNQTMRGTTPTPANPRLSSTDARSILWVSSVERASLLSACSFSMDRTRILSCPCSIARMVSSR